MSTHTTVLLGPLQHTEPMQATKYDTRLSISLYSQNVLMVKTPPLPRMLAEQSRINAHITVANGKSPMNSNALHFTYIPDGKHWSAMLSVTSSHQTQRSQDNATVQSIDVLPM